MRINTKKWTTGLMKDAGAIAGENSELFTKCPEKAKILSGKM